MRWSYERDRWFESGSLQQTVRLSPDFAFVPWKSPGFRQCGDEARRHGRQRRASSSNIALRNASVSIGRYSSTAVSPMRFATVGRPAAKRGWPLGLTQYDGAYSRDRLKQIPARSADRAKPAADASVPAACLRSDQAAGARREWLA